MIFSQSLSILSCNLKRMKFCCAVMNCQTSPSTTTITLQLKKTPPKSIITINMYALQNLSTCHERHRSSIDNVSSLHFVLKQASLKSKVKRILTCKVEILFFPRTLFGCMLTPSLFARIGVNEPLFCCTASLFRFFFSFLLIHLTLQCPAYDLRSH